MAAVLLLMGALLFAVPQARDAGTVGEISQLTTMAEVEAAISTTAPVLLQFDAKWCGYCRALQPHLQKLRDKNLKSELHMYQINISTAREVAAEFGVRSLPTMFIVYKGKVVGYKRGGISERELFDWVAGVQADIRKG
ncbi:MAG: thioredoxin family protein [Alphaproteobacteria bacterium]|nr:thioredoxin family protein [Alphaproteobacteria bacterium]